jgi:hypothetical protein
VHEVRADSYPVEHNAKQSIHQLNDRLGVSLLLKASVFNAIRGNDHALRVELRFMDFRPSFPN